MSRIVRIPILTLKIVNAHLVVGSEGCVLIDTGLSDPAIAVPSHDIGHTAVSLLISARVPLPLIAKIVGWLRARLSKWPGGVDILEQRSFAVLSTPSVPAENIRLRMGTAIFPAIRRW
jgi:hypothetical protein